MRGDGEVVSLAMLKFVGALPLPSSCLSRALSLLRGTGHCGITHDGRLCAGGRRPAAVAKRGTHTAPAGKTKRGWEAAKSRGAPTQRRKLLKRVWDDVDADGSGSLDKDELKTVLLRMGRVEAELDIDAVMAEVDDDGSGDVDFREFTEWFLRMEGSELEGSSLFS